jgi:hypothetical protein
MDIKAIEVKFGRKLPDSYINLVTNLSKIPDNEYKFKDRVWLVWNLEELNKKIEVKDAGIEPMFFLLKLYVKIFSNCTGLTDIESSNGSVPITRVANSFSFAEDNGDYLYMDPFDKCSVWIYYHDGSDVEKVSESFSTWLLESKRE